MAAPAPMVVPMLGASNVAPVSPTDPDVPTTRPFVPAVRKVPWHGNNAMLQNTSLMELANKGFIINHTNDQPSPSWMDFEFSGPRYETLRDNYRTYGHPDGAVPDATIHPCLRWDVWRSATGGPLSIPDYYVIRPALLMASCMLEEEGVLSFFKGLSERPQKELKVPDRVTKKFGGQKLYCFDASKLDANIPKQAEQVYQILANMRNFTTWRFTDEAWKMKCYGFTSPDLDTPGMVPHGDGMGTWSSTIKLAEEFLHALRNQVNATDYYYLQLPFDNADLNSAAKIRVYWKLAAVMLHELSHAFTIATWQRPLGKFNGRISFEPYFRDSRHTEIGGALESLVLGGRNSSLGGPGAPFGMAQYMVPSLSYNSVRRDLGSAFKYGDNLDMVWLIPMPHMIQFFHMDWWNDQVTRYGYYAWHVPEDQKTHLLKIRNRATAVDPDESPTLAPRRFLPLPTREEYIARVELYRARTALERAQAEIQAVQPPTEPAPAPPWAPEGSAPALADYREEQEQLRRAYEAAYTETPAAPTTFVPPGVVFEVDNDGDVEMD